MARLIGKGEAVAIWLCIAAPLAAVSSLSVGLALIVGAGAWRLARLIGGW